MSSVFDRMSLSYVFSIQVEMFNSYLENVGLGFTRMAVKGAISALVVVETREW